MELANNEEAAILVALFDNEPYLLNRMVTDLSRAAVEKNLTSIMKICIDNGFDSLQFAYPYQHRTFPYSRGQYTLYEIAAKEGSLDVLRMLVRYNPEGIKLPTNDGGTPLTEAACSGHIGVVEYLLQQKGFEINMKDTNGYTSLHYACSSKQFGMVEFLLKQKGVDVNMKDKNGRTPLHSACLKKQFEMVELLLKQEGVEINMQDTSGYTALHLCCVANPNAHKIICLLLKQKEIDVDIKDNSAWTVANLHDSDSVTRNMIANHKKQ